MTTKPATVATTPCIFDPDPAEDELRPDPICLSTDAFLHYASTRDGAYIRNLGPAFFSQHDIPRFETYEGVKILMGHPIFEFLRAVHADDLERATALMLLSGKTIRPKLNVPSFFFSRGSSDACFVTPAHLVRSMDMAVYLSRHLGVRFDLPDSEGRLPALYWAEHARDDALFSFAEQYLNIDVGQGGKLPDVRGEFYVRPIWRAIETNNAVAAKGLALCSTAGVNMPRPRDFCGYTPLMIQAVKVDHALQGTAEIPLKPAIKTAWALARSPNIRWDICDWEGHTLSDLPLDRRLRTFLDRARSNPWPSTSIRRLAAV